MKYLFSFLILLASTSAFAQFNWPEDPEKKKDAQTTYTLYDDSYKQGDYEGAKPHLEKLLTEYPTLSKAIYINGIKIYKELWKKEKDKAQKTAAAEKVMDLYDKRFEYFDGEEKKSIDRKAIDAFQFFYRDKAKTQFLLDMFEKTYEIKGDNAFYPVGRYYMNTAALAFARKIGISDGEILDIYNRTTQHIDAQIAKAKGKNQNTKKYDEIKQAIAAGQVSATAWFNNKAYVNEQIERLQSASADTSDKASRPGPPKSKVRTPTVSITMDAGIDLAKILKSLAIANNLAEIDVDLGKAVTKKQLQAILVTRSREILESI